MKFFLWTAFISYAYAVFTPNNRSELVTAVGSCISEASNGTCANFSASNDTSGAPYGHISTWDTSKVTDMSFMFSQANDFNQNISGWDTSKVTDMENMFFQTAAFNQDISAWDVSSVLNMKDMFQQATAINQDLNAWDVSSVTDMNNMFGDALSFNQDIGGWNTSQVTTMASMFYNAEAFNQFINEWDVGNVNTTTGVTNIFVNSGLTKEKYPCSSKWKNLGTLNGYGIDRTDCSLCDKPGHYGEYDNTTCIACPTGTYQNLPYQNFCTVNGKGYTPTSKEDLLKAIKLCLEEGGTQWSGGNGTCAIFSASTNDMYASNGNPYGHISTWDTSKITDMKKLFFLEM